MRLEIVVNGTSRRLDVEPRTLLVSALRDELNLTGTKIGCDTTHCGACTVLVDGDPVKSCTIFAVQAAGSEVTTVEGLPPPAGIVRSGFSAEHGLQCGFCTPGMIVMATALLDSEPAPSDTAIDEWFEGNLCRCTGYVGIRRAVRWAATKLAGEEPEILAGSDLAKPVVTSGTDGRAAIADTDFEVV